MKVTVIVPVYNAEPYLGEFIDSLCAQTYQDFDVIAVNDCSTDNSAAILESYKPFFGDRIKILCSNKNVGPGFARNIGMEHIPEDNRYVLFLDADDRADPRYLEKMVAAADESSADITICGMDRFDHVTGRSFSKEMISNPKDVITDVSSCKELAYINTFLWNKMFRRQLIGSTRFEPIKRWEDMIFLFRLLPDAGRIKFLNEALYHYRLRDTSLMRTITDELFETVLDDFLSMTRRMQKDEARYDRIKKQYETQVFIRFGVGAVCHRALENMKKTPSYIKQVKLFLDKTVPDWRKNPYLGLTDFFQKNYKEKAVAIAALLYKCNLFVLFVWAYWVLRNVLKRDTRW